jgi:hypothetical protein
MNNILHCNGNLLECFFLAVKECVYEDSQKNIELWEILWCHNEKEFQIAHRLPTTEMINLAK